MMLQNLHLKDRIAAPKYKPIPAAIKVARLESGRV
jgi:hypothetical protein